MLTIHCSALPRAISPDGCPASLSAPGIEISGDSDDAHLGRAAHAAMARDVMGEAVDLAAIADAHGVEESDLAPLFHQGRKLFDQYRDALDVTGVEVPVGPCIIEGAQVSIVGTADFFATTRDADKLLVNGDFKSTESRDPLDQQVGYIVAKHDGLPAPGKAIAFYLREGVADVRDITPEIIADWKARLRYAVAHPERFSPTPQNCQWCRRALECPGRTQLMRASLEAMADPGQDIAAMTPVQCGSLYLKYQAAGQYLKGVHDALREKCATEGPFILPDGREVALVDDRKEKVIVSDAWGIMADYFDVPEADLIETVGPILTIGKGKLAALIGAAAPKGQKGKKITAFLDALRDAGALQEAVGKTFSIRKAAKP